MKSKGGNFPNWGFMRSETCLAFHDSTKSVIVIWFKVPIVHLSFLAAINLGTGTDCQPFADEFKCLGHPINDRNDYDVVIPNWKFWSAA
jgi:hypothetical protein